MQGCHCLYRHFDADNALLYVGISSSLAARIETHRRASEWFPRVCSISVQHFATRAELEAAERAAIAAEKPPYNRRVDGAPKPTKPRKKADALMPRETDALRALRELVEAKKVARA